jgi:hypothetical protein
MITREWYIPLALDENNENKTEVRLETDKGFIFRDSCQLQRTNGQPFEQATVSQHVSQQRRM